MSENARARTCAATGRHSRRLGIRRAASRSIAAHRDGDAGRSTDRSNARSTSQETTRLSPIEASIARSNVTDGCEGRLKEFNQSTPLEVLVESSCCR